MLVAGGGPAGLTLAIGLGQLGVRCEVVDARPAHARVPRADRCGARTMEIFRRLGFSGRLRAAGLPGEASLDVLVCDGTLTRPVARHHFPAIAELLAAMLEVNDGTMPLEPPLVLSQYTLEPLLREAAEATRGVTVRFGAELIDFSAAGGGVTAMVRTGSGLRTIRADYLVGCDGAESTVRRTLGIELRGETRPPARRALICCPDLYDRLPGGRAIQYHVLGEHACTLTVQDDTQHFAVHAPAGGPPPGTLFETVTEDLARDAGQPLGFKVLHEGEWAQLLALADRYGDGGRVLLAGDAAHPASTGGGLGLSTAVADAADLAWKLAGTLAGWAGPGLLAGYEAERRPVAAQAITASFARAVAGAPWSADLPEVELGYRYTGSPVIADAEGTPADGYQYAPTTWPGGRLPHIWLDDGSPLHDLIGSGFTLLRLPGAATDRGAAGFARELAAEFGRLGAPLDVLDVNSAAAQAVYAGHRLILVRPDLHVAWRSGDSGPTAGSLAALVTGNVTP